MVEVSVALPQVALVRSSSMLLPIEQALDILKKWKEDSTSVFLVGQDSSRWGLRHIDEGLTDWGIGLHGKISEISVAQGRMASTAATAVFECRSGNLSLSMDGCAFAYDQFSGDPPSLLERGQGAAVSGLFIFFPSNELFVVYELQEEDV